MDAKLLIGKTIASIRQYREKNSEDEGYLHLTFSDGSQAMIVAYPIMDSPEMTTIGVIGMNEVNMEDLRLVKEDT